jgi:type 1 fimbria pilin
LIQKNSKPAWTSLNVKGVKDMDSKKRMMILSGLVSLFLVLGFFAQVYAAGTVTVKGEVIDTYCYSLMGAKGESHRQCAIDCFKAGIPAGLLENGTNKVYVLLPNKDKTSLPQRAILEKMGRQATITGKIYATGGSQFLTVESIK